MGWDEMGRDGLLNMSTETTETLLWYLVGGRFGRMSEAVSQHAFLPPLFGTYPEQDARPAPTAPRLDSTRPGLDSALLALHLALPPFADTATDSWGLWELHGPLS